MLTTVGGTLPSVQEPSARTAGEESETDEEDEQVGAHGRECAQSQGHDAAEEDKAVDIKKDDGDADEDSAEYETESGSSSEYETDSADEAGEQTVGIAGSKSVRPNFIHSCLHLSFVDNSRCLCNGCGSRSLSGYDEGVGLERIGSPPFLATSLADLQRWSPRLLKDCSKIY